MSGPALKPRDHRAVMASRRATATDDPDFYPTPPWGARAGGELIRRLDPRAASVWEPACGQGHMAHGLADYFETVQVSDLVPYGRHALYDFLGEAPPPFEADWIVTNPPFAGIEGFIRLAHARARRGVAMLMRAAVLESVGRHRLLFVDCPLTVFAPFCERLPMHKGRWEPEGSTAAFYAWFVWVKAGARRAGPPVIMPIAPGARARLTRPGDLDAVPNQSRARPERRLA